MARVDVVLVVGAAAAQVQVADQAVTIDTEQTAVGGVVTTRQIDQLPLNGRNYLELTRMEPGVEIQSGQFFDPTKTRYTGISIGGQNGREARITVDGIDSVDEHVGTTTLNLSQETIQEFQLSTSSSDLSTGVSSTGAVNIITKAGTNQFARDRLRLRPRLELGRAPELFEGFSGLRALPIWRERRQRYDQRQAVLFR